MDALILIALSMFCISIKVLVTLDHHISSFFLIPCLVNNDGVPMCHCSKCYHNYLSHLQKAWYFCPLMMYSLITSLTLLDTIKWGAQIQFVLTFCQDPRMNFHFHFRSGHDLDGNLVSGLIQQPRTTKWWWVYLVSNAEVSWKLQLKGTLAW